MRASKPLPLTIFKLKTVNGKAYCCCLPGFNSGLLLRYNGAGRAIRSRAVQMLIVFVIQVSRPVYWIVPKSIYREGYTQSFA